MKLAAFPNPMLRIAIGMLAVVLVAYLLELPPIARKSVLEDFRSYHFQKEKSHTFYMQRLSEGLTFTFIPKADFTVDTGNTVGPGLSAPQARLAESGERSAGMSAVITPQPTLADPNGKEVAFVSGP
jgi:hypothetical protein